MNTAAEWVEKYLGSFIRQMIEAAPSSAVGCRRAAECMVLAVVFEERARCAEAVDAEEELDGLPSLEEFAAMQQAGLVATCRAIVKVTKRNIRERIACEAEMRAFEALRALLR